MIVQSDAAPERMAQLPEDDLAIARHTAELVVTQAGDMLRAAERLGLDPTPYRVLVGNARTVLDRIGG